MNLAPYLRRASAKAIHSLLAAASVATATATIGISTSHAQSDFPIAGDPKGNVQIELLQSRAYCIGIEIHLAKIERRFPELAFQVLAARTAWEASPFASGNRAIEEDIVTEGPKGREVLDSFDLGIVRETTKMLGELTLDEAKDFLKLVGKRARGEIEVDMVKGHLLWWHPPFKENPEKEYAAGYTTLHEHDAIPGHKITLTTPMSWKPEKIPNVKEALSFRNHYGHGRVWMSINIGNVTNKRGERMDADVAYELYTDDYLHAMYEKKGVQLTSILKTKLNGMPAIMLEREQTYEQLGKKFLIISNEIKVFYEKNLIILEIMSGSAGGKFGASSTAVDNIDKHQELFELVAGSLSIKKDRSAWSKE